MEVTKREIIEQLYATEFVENYAKSVAKEIDWVDIEDILGELWLQICSLEEEKLIALYTEDGINGIRRYIAGLIVRQLCSSSSTIYKKYKRYRMNTVLDGLNNIGKKFEEG